MDTAFWIIFPIVLSGLGFLTYNHPEPMKKILKEAGQYSLFIAVAIYIFKMRVDHAYDNSKTAIFFSNLTMPGVTDTSVFRQGVSEYDYHKKYYDKAAEKIEQDRIDDLWLIELILKYSYILVPTIVVFFGLSYLFEHIKNAEKIKDKNRPPKAAD